MKIDSFALIEKRGNSFLNYCFKATVTVETGVFFKKKKNIEVFRSYGCHWRFVDTGKFTPDLLVEELEASYLAKLMLPDLCDVII